MASKSVQKAKPAAQKATKKSHEIKTAGAAEADDVIDTIVMAFAADPVCRWFYPTPDTYLEYFPELLRIYGGKAFHHEAAYYAEDFAGGALWLPPGVHPDDEALGELLEKSVPADRLDTTLEAFEALEDYHPDEPHWHLPAIGVEPTKQSKGYGSALLEEQLAKCDEQGVPAYLESTNPTNVSLYLRHGFEIVGTVERGEMPPFIPMVRRP